MESLRYSFYPKFSDRGKELTCSLEEDIDGEDKEALYDSITIASVVLFDASKCFHCTFDPNGEFSKGKLVTINSKIKNANLEHIIVMTLFD